MAEDGSALRRESSDGRDGEREKRERETERERVRVRVRVRERERERESERARVREGREGESEHSYGSLIPLLERLRDRHRRTGRRCDVMMR